MKTNGICLASLMRVNDKFLYTEIAIEMVDKTQKLIRTLQHPTLNAVQILQCSNKALNKLQTLRRFPNLLTMLCQANIKVCLGKLCLSSFHWLFYNTSLLAKTVMNPEMSLTVLEMLLRNSSGKVVPNCPRKLIRM